ncbi:receptor-like protein kinase ANXUR1 [Syzygium oleosum]|uniref:receptor-like protein kinase ANXUR1 n=1 Tax=Syzygium oleosum TaxID=219896 RepID=UPI0011D21FEC|nr:receptor-like protein kinase ANXUR1 [Syzygium oleosum]
MYKNIQILLSIISVSVLFDSLYASSADPTPLILSCGSTGGGKDADGRKWDSDSKYFTSNNSTVEKATYQDPSLPSDVPYMSARIFTSEATYQLPVKSGNRYWVRLHFYPSTYGSLDPADAYFSVVAGSVTLLKNFSASVTAQALTQAYLVKEYSLAPLDSDFVNITFAPSDKHSGAYAFVNGIELIPIPDLFDSAQMVGFSDQPVDAKAANLQTMYRLNVGGQYIPPSNDSGTLTRTWYDDTPYLYGAVAGVTNEADKKVQIQYNDLPDYVAPVDVYRTARSMGYDKNLNKNYNLTWQFQVDANFTYLVRMHFCEYFLTKVNQRVFDIYINNQVAQEAADVIGWASEQGVPVYKDYAIYVGDGKGDEQISIMMNPSVTADPPPEYYDALLNGLEIFKITDATENLAGPNPEPSEMLIKAEAEAAAKASEAKAFTSSTTSNVKLITGAAGGAAAFGALAAICITVYVKKKRVPGTESHTTSWLPISGFSHTAGSKSHASAASHLSSEAQCLSRRFSLAEIKQATKNFDESYVIGVGGFGKVYKGVIDKTMKVAIKRSNPSSEQGVNEFQTEVEMLSKLRHKHLVSLIGYCEEENEMCLVYDYMARGTMREHIYKGNNTPLSWKQRLEICIGAARGLHYLHTGARYTIIHRDVKTTNILLDENWVAKVSDFGLSKTGPNMDKGHVSTVVKGSFGYLDPEYFRRQQLTEKSDVYSFGVVLFEVLCARPALNPSLPKEQVSLADWALHCQRKGILEDIIDAQLKGKINPECLKKFAETAEKCLCEHGLERPTMGDVLWNLEFALQLQENADGSSHSSHRAGSNVSEEVAPRLDLNSLSIGSEHELSQDSDDMNAIFSQIVNPKGR